MDGCDSASGELYNPSGRTITKKNASIWEWQGVIRVVQARMMQAQQ
jgi:hypothetical protein